MTAKQIEFYDLAELKFWINMNIDDVDKNSFW